nr:unnamed protein product [Callosobruchus chinensis]
MIQESTRQVAEYTSKVARHVKLQQYDLAEDAIRRELGLHQQNESYQATGRLTAALLARGDVVAAEKAFKEWGNYCEGSEVQTLEALLQANDEEDPKGAKRAWNSPFMKHMEVEYAILARDMPLPEASAAPAPKVTQNNATVPLYEMTKIDADDEIPQCTVKAEDTAAPPISEAPDDEDEYAGGYVELIMNNCE